MHAALAALLAANELLRYRPIDDLYEEWLDRVAELVRAAGGSPAPSLSLLRPPSPRATWLMERLHHLCPKTAPWRQGARPHGVIRHVRCPRVKREAAKKFPGREKLHLRSLRRLAKTARYLRWRHAGLMKTKLHLRSGPRLPRLAAEPSPRAA